MVDDKLFVADRQCDRQTYLVISAQRRDSSCKYAGITSDTIDAQEPLAEDWQATWNRTHWLPKHRRQMDTLPVLSARHLC